MADITKCFDCEKYCSDYKMCYRFTAKDNLYYQSYCEFHHKKETDMTKCKDFWIDRKNYKLNLKEKDVNYE